MLAPETRPTLVPTREHWRIERWAHMHGALPAQLQRLKVDGEPAILTFVFGELLTHYAEIVPITWESFFAQFDLMKLSMAFDEETSRFEIVKVGERSAAYPDRSA